LGLKSFGPDADDDATAMVRELRAAQRKDRTTRHGNDTNRNIVRGVVAGDVTQIESEFEDAMFKWMELIRQRFASVVIRRTIYSTDNNGNRISGLQPFQEHLLVLQLYPAEMENIDSIAKDMISDANHSATTFAGSGVSHTTSCGRNSANPVSQHFYLKIRRALLHPSCNSNHPWGNPTTIDEWKKDPSRKLDALVQILQYHLSAPDRPYLHVQGNQLVPSSPDAAIPSMGVDKIVVYMAFPTSNLQVLAVSISFHHCYAPSLTSSTGTEVVWH
jgi:hypothetical protein